MNKLSAAVLIVSALALGTVALRATPASSGAVFVDSDPNGSSLTTDTMQPATNLVATASGTTAGEIDLSWTASVSIYTSAYAIYRATAPGGPYTLVTSVAGTSYPDTGLTSTQAYYYYVVATYQNWTSADSGGASANAP